MKLEEMRNGKEVLEEVVATDCDERERKKDNMECGVHFDGAGRWS